MAQPATPGGNGSRSGASPAGLRRVLTTLALLRWPTLAVAAGFALFLPEGVRLPLYGLLALIAVYNGVLLVASRTAPESALNLVGYGGIVLDTAALSIAIALTGGFESELHIAYYAIAINVSIYFRARDAAIATVLYAIGYGAAITWANGAEVWDAIWPVFTLRIAFLALAGFFVGYMARERAALSETNQALRVEVARRLRAERLIAGIGSALGLVRDPTERDLLFQEMADELRPFGLALAVLLPDARGDRFHPVYVSLTPEESARVQEALGRPLTSMWLTVTAAAYQDLLRERRPLFVEAGNPLLLDSAEPALDDQARARLFRAVGGFRSVLCAFDPGTGSTGLCLLMGEELSQDDVPAVELFVGQLAIGLRTIERLRELERLGRSKGEFLAMISHELKTPLTAVKAAAELLDEIERREPDSARARLVRSIGRGVANLERMVMELLDFARMEDSELVLERGPVMVHDLVDEVVAWVQPLMAEKNQQLEHHVAPGLQPLVCDGYRIGQVLTNLVTNASKYTQAGGRIWLGVDEDHGKIVFRVGDNGPGIDPEEQPFLFDPFFRGAQAQRVALSGSGLGLAIARSLVELHGGTIWVNSRPGEGAEFGFAIPYEYARQEVGR